MIGLIITVTIVAFVFNALAASMVKDILSDTILWKRWVAILMLVPPLAIASLTIIAIIVAISLTGSMLEDYFKKQ